MEYSIIAPSSLPKLSVYLTHADSFLQKRCKLDASELTREMRFSCLSQRSIVIPTSFILKSDLTFEAVRNNLALLENGVLIPAISKGCESFSSYCELKENDKLFLRKAGLTKSDLRAKVHLLENHSKLVLSYDEESMNKSYIRSLTDDILPLIEDKHKALDTLNNLPRIKREYVLKGFEWLPKDKFRKLGEYLDLLYYFQGGTFNNLSLDIHPSYIPQIRAKIVKALPIAKLPANYDCFKEAINVLNLSQNILLSLDPEKILALRNDPSVKRFLSTLEEIYEKTRRSIESQVPESSVFQAMGNEVNEAINSTFSSEAKRLSRYKRTKNILKGFAYTTGLLSLLGLGPVLGPAAMLVYIGTGYKLMDPFLDEIWKRIGNCEMIFFTQILLDASRKPVYPQSPKTPRSFLKKCVKCAREIPIASEECPYCRAKQPRNLG